MELRNVVARIVTEFDTKFAPGEDGRVLMEESKDTFTMELAPLELVFTKRKEWESVSAAARIEELGEVAAAEGIDVLKLLMELI